MEQGPILKRIDNAANKWNETKDPQYKDLWYKLIKEFADGPHNIKRRVVPINPSVKTDDGRYQVIRRPKLLRLVRYTQTKTNRLRRHVKPAHHE
jgi:hypothetical protein